MSAPYVWNIPTTGKAVVDAAAAACLAEFQQRLLNGNITFQTAHELLEQVHQARTLIYRTFGKRKCASIPAVWSLVLILDEVRDFSWAAIEAMGRLEGDEDELAA